MSPQTLSRVAMLLTLLGAPAAYANGPGFEVDCKECSEVLIGCLGNCSGRGCDACVTSYETCLAKEGCEDLKPSCDQCLEDAETCADRCTPGDDNCLGVCTNTRDACWQLNDCDGPYVETTPICNYLERGIDDLRKEVTDSYSVVPPGVTTFAGIEKLEFGLDLPATNCNENPHTIPCAGRSYDTEWLIDEVTLSIRGIEFFHEVKSPTAQFLKHVSGGSSLGGISGWTGAQLRMNPSWGLSENEALSLIGALPVPEDGTAPDADAFKANLGAVTLSEERVAALIEGSFGRTLADRLKSGNDSDACSGSLYCDNGRGLQFAWRGTYGVNQPDCDLGGCPPVGNRKSSPWVELTREVVGGATDQDLLVVDLDVEVLNGVASNYDCPFGVAQPCIEPKGTKYNWLAEFGIQLKLEPQCVPGAGALSAIRFQPVDIQVDIEGGVPAVTTIAWFVDTACGIWGSISGNPPCSANDIVTGFVEEDITTAIAEETFIDDLDACPPAPVADIGPAGSITLDISAPSGATGARKFASNRFVRWARILQEAQPAAPAFQSLYGAHVNNVSITQPWNQQLADQIIGYSDPDAKQSFARLDEAQVSICVMTGTFEYDVDDDGDDETVRVCDPALNLDNVDLPLPLRTTIAPFKCVTNAFPNPTNDARCELLAQIKAWAMQPEIMTHCIEYNANGTPLDQVLEDSWEGLAGAIVGCRENLPSVEKLVPVPSIELDIKTGREHTSDTFAFVDVSEPSSLTKSVYDSNKCRNRLSYSLTSNPHEYSQCGDPDDPNEWGLEGCPCRDVVVSQFDDILLDGGFPDGAGSYVAHGSYGPGQYCEDDTNEQIVCGKIVKNGIDEYAECMKCGDKTMIGCSCETNADCDFPDEPDLKCVGSPQEEGWPGSARGTCLPDPGTSDGQEALEEMRWFCLDNCDAIDGYASHVGGCYFDQWDTKADHGVCVNTLNTCDGISQGTCEAENQMVCRDAGPPDVCEEECTSSAQCATLGFPSHYVCDNATFYPGHCVPPSCAGPSANPFFCQQYR